MNQRFTSYNVFGACIDLYNVFWGDIRWRRNWLKRRGRADAILQGRDLSNLVELGTLTREIEKELDITEISGELPPYMGSPASEYYEAESPEEFYKKREQTVRQLNRLEPLESKERTA